MNAIEKRIQFLVEADKLKSILRQSTLIYDRTNGKMMQSTPGI